MITAKVTTTPKIMPIMIKRLFMSKIPTSQLKTDCMRIGDKYGRML